jgi:hypothetical protein
MDVTSSSYNIIFDQAFIEETTTLIIMPANYMSLVQDKDSGKEANSFMYIKLMIDLERRIC